MMGFLPSLQTITVGSWQESSSICFSLVSMRETFTRVCVKWGYFACARLRMTALASFSSFSSAFLLEVLNSGYPQVFVIKSSFSVLFWGCFAVVVVIIKTDNPDNIYACNTCVWRHKGNKTVSWGLCACAVTRFMSFLALEYLSGKNQPGPTHTHTHTHTHTYTHTQLQVVHLTLLVQDVCSSGEVIKLLFSTTQNIPPTDHLYSEK